MIKNLLLAAVVIAGSAQPSLAAGPTAGEVVIIITTPDLQSAAGRHSLDRRIESAIEDVCGSHATIESSQEEEVTRCRTAARRSVDQQLADAGRREVRLTQQHR